MLKIIPYLAISIYLSKFVSSFSNIAMTVESHYYANEISNCCSCHTQYIHDRYLRVFTYFYTASSFHASLNFRRNSIDKMMVRHSSISAPYSRNYKHIIVAIHDLCLVITLKICDQRKN